MKPLPKPNLVSFGCWLLPVTWVCAGCEYDWPISPENRPTLDASLPSDPAQGWLAEPFFPGQSDDVEAFDALRDAVAGQTFWGVTVYEDARTVPFEIDFREDGTFATRCLFALSCEPFGVGSEGDGDLRWDLITLDDRGRGVGEIRIGLIDYPYLAPFRDMEYDPRRGVLSFFVTNLLVSQGALGGSPIAAVVLTEGQYDGREPDAEAVAEGNPRGASP